MANEQSVIRLRLDVDYPYPSRTKSFLYVALGIKGKRGRDYLKNSRIIAKMINESPRKVRAYWFFTPYTIPDRQLLDLLVPDRHEVALHVTKDPYREWKILENETQCKITYYTIHGTSRLFAQLIWGRKIGEKQTKVPADFPLKTLPFNMCSLDKIRFERGLDGAQKAAEEWITRDDLLTMHPEWLFDKSKRNGRGPIYDVLKRVLDVDKELATLQIKKRFVARIAHDVHEYEKDIVPTERFLEKLGERRIDLYTFLERKWCCSLQTFSSTWKKAEDNVGLLEIKDYETWWSTVGKKTRNMVRRAEKSGIKVDVVEPSLSLAEGISKIYNETPIRQERAFSHYGEPLQTVSDNMFAAAPSSSFIGAFLGEELVGFIQLIYGEKIAIVSQILSMQKHWDKAVNNALLAKAVEISASKGERWLMYGRIGNHPSLDKFKESNGFVKFRIARYYIPLSWQGRVAIRLGLHREFRDALPQTLKGSLIPLMNWVSRTIARSRASRV